jgi:hypothetical protein
MMSTGKRYPAKLGQADADIPRDYPAVSRSGELAAGQLDDATASYQRQPLLLCPNLNENL